jgi:hypothetical protein
MPTYTVIGSKDGSIRLLTRDQMDERNEKKSSTGKSGEKNARGYTQDEKELGEFTAENMQEARRMFVSLNPSVDLSDTGMRIAVQVGQQTDAASAEKKSLEDKLAEVHQSAVDEAMANLQMPQGGDPQAYSDDAHVARGEMLSREDRDAAKEAERQQQQQPRGQDVMGLHGDRSRTGQQVVGNRGKQGNETSSRNAGTGGQPAGVVDAGSPNAGTVGPVSGTTGAGVGNQGGDGGASGTAGSSGRSTGTGGKK